MNFPKAISMMLAVFFGILSSPVNAQINLKTGYTLSFLSDKNVDGLLAAFNASRDYDKKFKDLRWMHGFEAGIRFKSDVNALELNYMGAYQSLRAKGPGPSGAERNDKLKFNVQSVGLSYQITSGFFGLGAELQYQWYITRAELADPDTRFKEVQKMWAEKFYLLFVFEGSGGVDLALEPYYILPSKRYDSVPLQSFLSIDYPENNTRWNRIGLSIIFYNGRK